MLYVFLTSLIQLALSQNCDYNQVNFGDTCLDQCPQNTVLTATNYGSSCLECDITRFQVLSEDRSRCVCAKQTYWNNYLEQCIPCHYTCFTCYGPSSRDCGKCDTDSPSTFRFKHNQLCTCQPGYYEDLSSPSLKCFPCHTDCLTCSGPQDSDCIQCAYGKNKDQFGLCSCPQSFVDNGYGTCICPPLLFISPDGFCKNKSNQCGYNQKQLSGPQNIASSARKSNCTCQDGYYRVKKVCTKCGTNQVYNAGAGKCVCDPKAIKVKKECIICPVGQLFNRKTSECSCKKNEQKTESNTCVKCPPKSIYSNGACICIFNYYIDKSGKCKRCNRKSDHPACIQVTGDIDRPKRLDFQSINY